MQRCSQAIRHLTFTLAIFIFPPLTSHAQEVASVDLTKISARTKLRRPEATSPATGGYSSTQQTSACRDSEHKLGLLRTSVVSLDRTHYQEGDKSTFEVTVENAGSSPIRIPFSPHLADLQPRDASKKFAYSELHVVLWIGAGEKWSSNSGGGVTLYGDEEHSDTMLSLNPGQWVRIVGRGKFDVPRDQLSDQLIHSHEIDTVYAQASLSREETLITATHSATVSQELCVAPADGQTSPIQLIAP